MLLSVWLLFPVVVQAYNTSMIVPAYFSEQSKFDQLATAGLRLRDRLVVIVNPNNGPNGTPEQRVFYANVARQISNTGAKIIGYVYTQLGERNSADVINDINGWWGIANMDGIFLDECAVDPSKIPLYQQYTATARAQNSNALVVCNQGGISEDSGQFLAAVDVLVVAEDYQKNFNADRYVAPWLKGSNAPSRAAMMSHGGSDFACVLSWARTNGIAWTYSTDDKMDNPWDELPSFWSEYVDAVVSKEVFDKECKGGVNVALIIGIIILLCFSCGVCIGVGGAIFRYKRKKDAVAGS